MRKNYLMTLTAAALVSLSANAVDYYLTGGFINWGKQENCKFVEGDNGTYTLSYQGVVTSGFKINDGGWTNKDNTYGAVSSSTKLVIGEEFTLAVGDASQNIEVENALSNPTFTFNPTAKTLLVEAGQAESVITYDIWSNFSGGSSWASTTLTEADGIWSAENVVVSKAAEFGIRKLDNGSQVDWLSASSSVNVTETTEVSLKSNGTNIKIAAGTYDFALDVEGMKLSVTKVGGGDDPIIPPTPEKELYLVGDQFGGWEGINAEYKMTREGNVYTIVLPDGLNGGSWKIWDGTWDYNFGAGAEPLVANADCDVWFDAYASFTLATSGSTTITLTVVEGSDVKGSSIAAKLRVDNDSDPIIPPTPDKDLYLVGDQFGWTDVNETYAMERNDNVYTITLKPRLDGTNWKIWNGSWNYSFGAGAEQPVIGTECDVWFNSPANFTTGSQDVVKITLTVTEGSDKAGSSIPAVLLIDVPSAVEKVEEVAEEGEVRYFNLQGVEINNPANGVFVRVANGKASKVVK